MLDSILTDEKQIRNNQDVVTQTNAEITMSRIREQLGGIKIYYLIPIGLEGVLE